jgi:membrane protease YdiL (CAAX protease family)
MDHHFVSAPVPPNVPHYGTGDARPYSKKVAAICWSIIVICVAVVAVANWRASKTPARIEAAADVQLLMTSRTLVGAFHHRANENAVASNMAAGALANVAQNASPKQDLLLVSVRGELEGPKAAENALDECAKHIVDPSDRADLKTLRTIYSLGPERLNPDERSALIAHDGWFARLALSFGRPDTDPLRARVLHEAKRAAIAGYGFEALVVLGILAGIGLLITATVLRATGRLHLCYGRAPSKTTAFLEAFALYLAGYISIGLIARLIGHGSLILGPALSLAWIIFAMLWPLFRGVSWQQLRGGLGWYRGQGIVREAAAGVIGYLAGLPIIALSAVLAYVLSARTHTPMNHPLMFSDTRGAWAIIQLYLLASVFAPLVEETMFRGALFNHLRQWQDWFLSAVFSSIIFAALHPQGWAAIPVLGSIGFVLASIREWRGTFVSSVAAHALNNGMVTTLLVLTLQ